MASPFFKNLNSAYRAELDDLTFDSEGKDVLRQRLADKRKEMGFLVKMMALSPEMVAVVFHQAFAFAAPAVMDNLLGFEADELPDWSTLENSVTLAPWAQSLADAVLSEPDGQWFLTVAASLEYLSGKTGADAGDAQDDESDEEEDEFDGDAEERADAKARKEAGDDWMAEQGFERKE